MPILRSLRNLFNCKFFFFESIYNGIHQYYWLMIKRKYYLDWLDQILFIPKLLFYILLLILNYLIFLIILNKLKNTWTSRNLTFSNYLRYRLTKYDATLQIFKIRIIYLTDSKEFLNNINYKIEIIGIPARLHKNKRNWALTIKDNLNWKPLIMIYISYNVYRKEMNSIVMRIIITLAFIFNIPKQNIRKQFNGLIVCLVSYIVE